MQFYCTAGRGTEAFVHAELSQLFRDNLEQVITRDGKIFFTVNQSKSSILAQLMSLKSVERLFVQVLHRDTGLQDKRSLLTLLHTCLNSRGIWTECISTIRHLQQGNSKPYNTEMPSKPDQTNVCITSPDPSNTNTYDNLEDVNMRTSDILQSEATKEGCTAICTSECVQKMDTHGIADNKPVTKSRRKNNETSKCSQQAELNSNTNRALDGITSNLVDDKLVSETDTRLNRNNEDTYLNFDSNLTYNTVMKKQFKQVSEKLETANIFNFKASAVTKNSSEHLGGIEGILSFRNIDDQSVVEKNSGHNETCDWSVHEKKSEYNISSDPSFLEEKSGHNKRPYNKNGFRLPCKSSGKESLAKKRKLTIVENSHVTFRVSCKFSGSVRRKLDIQRTSKQMGVLISKLMGWKTCLTQKPQMEICVHLNDEVLTVGIPLFSEPLSKRTYIQHWGLRSTVAWIMTQLLHVQPGDTVMDPMCGKATILLEVTQICKTVTCIGMDKEGSQLHLAAENLSLDNQSRNIHLVQGSTKNIPLPDNSVDKIVTDAPFGQNHTTDTDIVTFYTDMLTEISRVLKPGGDIVLLTSMYMKDVLQHSLLVHNNINTKKSNTSNSISDQAESNTNVNTVENSSNIAISNKVENNVNIVKLENSTNIPIADEAENKLTTNSGKHRTNFKSMTDQANSIADEAENKLTADAGKHGTNIKPMTDQAKPTADEAENKLTTNSGKHGTNIKSMTDQANSIADEAENKLTTDAGKHGTNIKPMTDQAKPIADEAENNLTTNSGKHGTNIKPMTDQAKHFDNVSINAMENNKIKEEIKTDLYDENDTSLPSTKITKSNILHVQSTASVSDHSFPALFSHLRTCIMFKQSFYVKLANTDGQICVLKKIKI